LSAPTRPVTLARPPSSAANPMRSRPRATATDLRRAIDCLPRHTRVAMLEGIDVNPIIVGAYSNEDGVCPMLAAHRAGGRTSLIAFARAWDRLAFRDARKARARWATGRELRVLKTHLEASVLEDEAPQAGLAAPGTTISNFSAAVRRPKPRPAIAPARRPGPQRGARRPPGMVVDAPVPAL
jgi:hypothetical protein